MKFIRYKSCVVLLLLLIVQASPAQSIWNRAHLEMVKSNLHRPFYGACYKALIHQANNILRKAPLSVMQKSRIPASGDKHDYMSLSRYYWPNPDTPDSLPYLRRDGESNPELKQFDRNNLSVTASRITKLALAWYFSGDEKYARKATELIQVWFFNPDTRMNPNLNYSQMIPGLNGGKGRNSGVLDSYSFVEMLDAVDLLDQSKAFTANDSRQLKAWFGQLLQWILTSPNGQKEATTKNNHAIACDVQTVAFALYSGHQDIAEKTLRAFPAKRIFTQIEPDGQMPMELQRTLGFGYSEFNISHMTDIFLIAANRGMKLDQKVSADGRSFYKAVDFLTPYLGDGKRNWKYKQISGWESKQNDLCKDLYRIAKYLNPSRTDYLQLFREYRHIDFSEPFFLIDYEPTAEDDALAQKMGY